MEVKQDWLSIYFQQLSWFIQIHILESRKIYTEQSCRIVRFRRI